MVFDSYDKNRHQLKWRCPKKVGNMKVRSAACLACSEDCSPSPSSYGQTVHTKTHDDLRLFTKTPRGSGAWKKVYNGRSASVRVNKRSWLITRLNGAGFAAINSGIGVNILRLSQHTLMLR
jgi:hypothetical protein